MILRIKTTFASQGIKSVGSARAHRVVNDAFQISHKRLNSQPTTSPVALRGLATAVQGGHGYRSHNDSFKNEINRMTWAAPWLVAAAAATGGTATLLEEPADSRWEEDKRNQEKEAPGVIATSYSRPELGGSVFARQEQQQNNVSQVKSRKTFLRSRTRPDLRSLSKALEERDERQKVALARLLHEFHVLAEEAGKKEQAAKEQEQEASGTEVMASKDTSTSLWRRIRPKSAVKVTGAQDDKVITVPKMLSHLKPKVAWDIIDQLREGGSLQKEDLKRIAKTSVSELLKEPTLIDLRNRTGIKQITVVGDLHGQFSSLSEVLSILGDRKSRKGAGTPWDGSGVVVFNGDFVDRGSHSLEVMVTLLLLKLAYPRHVYLNRGNHEDSVISTVYGYYDELKGRYGKDGSIDDLWDCFVDVFAALPICVRTNSAAILHGGIPSSDFKLSELEAISAEDRFRIKTTVEPGDDALCLLFHDILWSDPRPQNGLRHNADRGAGRIFGPDVARSFLSKNGLKLLIRSHELVDDGHEQLPCGDEHSTVTVFSASGYPDGTGCNRGAVIRLVRDDGSYEPVPFKGQTMSLQNKDGADEFQRRTLSSMTRVIAENRHSLETKFAEMAEKTYQKSRQKSSSASPSSVEGEEIEQAHKTLRLITCEQWAEVMSNVLGLPNMDWLSFQPYLAPTIIARDPASTKLFLGVFDIFPFQKTNDGNASAKREDSGLIDYHKFLDQHCSVNMDSDYMQHLDRKTIDSLLQNQAVLLTVFKFLDTDQNGTVDRKEFREGMKMLRKRFPERDLQDADQIFDAIDVDRSGTIELIEFEKAFQTTEVPYPIALVKLFDKDRSGTIDRQEFKEGLKLLNQRLPLNEQVHNGDDLFDTIDVNNDGEIDLEELRAALRSFFPDI